MLAVGTEFKDLIVLATVNALGQNMTSIFVYDYRMILEIDWGILSVMV